MPQRKLELTEAVAIGIASMIGAGVFVVFREATAIAGAHLWISLLLASTVASLNAASVYQLASAHDRPGGVYAYSRIYLNDTWSFVAGFSFVFGKIGSIAAIALALGEYLQPWPKVVSATAAVFLLAAFNILGINRTAMAAKVLASITLIYFVVAAVGGISVGIASGDAINTLDDGNPLGILPAAAVLFFAFAGYARVANLGHDVRDAKKNVPRAIRISLLIVILIYIALAVALVLNFGNELASLPSPFIELFEQIWPTVAGPITRLVATAACLGSMLALLAGVSRTAATMAEDRELPASFARRNRHGSPWLAESSIALGSILLLLSGNLTWVIGFSSLSVLLYYAIGHLSAFRQTAVNQKVRRAFVIAGFTLCLILLIAVPGPALWVSTLILLLAVAVRAVARNRSGR